ncbi:hypothetical protein QJS10_CPA02g01135 [Acorus calamus]|uniref:tRNA 4-demethylwyosine synthase (AdoMet-dependent) n=1 Tax=Acorus calamus TaxID=4465 RepID=A0AAV9FCX0_ACOCL|nr:hypothetical protein QJS10_CPA02g01135 [Acorus calamus]
MALVSPSRLALLALVSISAFCLYKSRRLRRQKKLLLLSSSSSPNPSRGKIFFASETGTSKTLASRLSAFLRSEGLDLDLVDPADYEPDDLLRETLVIFVASTWEDGGPPRNAGFLARWLEDGSADFRVGSAALAGCRFAVFGVGSRAYGRRRFNAFARDLSGWMRGLGAVEVVRIGEGDVDGGGVDVEFERWSQRLAGVLKGGVLDSGLGVVGEAEGFEGDEEEGTDSEEDVEAEESGVVDLEDIAGKGPSRRSSSSVLKSMVLNGEENGLKEMGYKIIGSHSGVKLCRWTKSQLRGRGGCYKHSFYGIESHRCMEATPSLACANKCVFCWRHHTNPVGKSWKWKMDDPLEIVNAAIDQHTKMIKQMKGVPGVNNERLSEGLAPRHCALSLVGEPIIKDKALKPVTQLYVSVDAATKDSLKAIDRPLFGDFWERFVDSLKALYEKEQRTVYRLTLVKGWNAEDIDAYSSLLGMGNPDLVEIKGVTYCGSSATSKLTMENVPWHADVRAFSEALALKSNGEYEVACEHVHSCCVLLAKVTKYNVNGRWHTWIDYDKFHDLVASGKPFSSEDYMAPTPLWAIYGAEEGGFDPDQSRYKKERRHGAAALQT